VNIREFCSLRAGTSFPRKVIASDHGDYWVLESFCINHNGDINFDNLVHVSSADMTRPSRPLSKNDILIRAKGSHHQAILFDTDNKKYHVYPTSYFLVLTVNQPDKVLPNFLTWLLNQPTNQSIISSFAGGATVKHLTKARFSLLELDIPDLYKQNQILRLDKFLKKEQRLLSEISELRTEYYSTLTSKYLGGLV